MSQSPMRSTADEARSVLTLGSAPDNDIPVKQAGVAPRHARIVRQGEFLFVEDMGAPEGGLNGTTLNGKPLAMPSPVRAGDVLGLGPSATFRVEAQHLRPLLVAHHATSPVPTSPAFAPPSGPPPASAGASGKTSGSLQIDIPSGAQFISLGFHEDNTVSIPVAQVSGYHCRIWKDGDTYILEDLGSTNGTWLNNAKVRRAFLRPGDQIGLGSYRFAFDGSLTKHFRHAKPDDENKTRVGDLPAISARPVRIGRDDTPGVNDIAIAASMISNEHCELTPTSFGWKVRDLGSTNGTFVNSTHNRIKEATVTDKDILFFGSYRFPVSRVYEHMPNARPNGSSQAPETLSIANKELIILGRDEGCDLRIDAPQVSRKHARLTQTKDAAFLEDLGSANGTFVNGQRITSRTPIGPDDWISLGSYQIKLDLRSGKVQRSYHGDLMLQADNITVKVNSGKKTLLKNISFTVYPTEFVGLMGLSGSGKTTLMMALNGYLPPSEGRSLLNGLDLYQHYNSFRGNLGYVPQDDIIHPELTVWESLYYTAKLRLPPDTRDKEIRQIIDQILDQLEIKAAAQVLIGSPEKKGISGGQRKRVNLAQELITQPSMLFLDEPTSGLSSEDTHNVIRLLRKMADEGRTILLTIHQPSLDAYRQMDNIVYLADGSLIYYGPSYPDSLTFFNPSAQAGTPEGDRILSDPGNVLKAITEQRKQNVSSGALEDKYKASNYFQEYVQRRRSENPKNAARGPKQKIRRRFGVRQWFYLSLRYFTIKRKDTLNTAILMSQSPIIATIIALVFASEVDDGPGRIAFSPFALFLMVTSAVWFGCSNSAREVVSEQAIYRRERMVNLKIPSYILSKFTVLGGICFVQCLMFLSILYLPLGLEGAFSPLLIVLVLCSWAGLGMGLVLSSLVKTSEAAIGLVPLILIPQIILGGAIMPIQKLNPLMRAASSLMITRWGFEALIQVEDAGEVFELSSKEIDKLEKDARKNLKAPPPSGAPAPMVQLPQHPLDKYFGKHEAGFGRDALVLLVFNLLLLLTVMSVLKVKDPEAS